MAITLLVFFTLLYVYNRNLYLHKSTNVRAYLRYFPLFCTSIQVADPLVSLKVALRRYRLLSGSRPAHSYRLRQIPLLLERKNKGEETDVRSSVRSNIDNSACEEQDGGGFP